MKYLLVFSLLFCIQSASAKQIFNIMIQDRKLYNTKQTVFFNWPKIKNTKFYIFQVSEDQNFKKLIKAKKSKSNSIEIDLKNELLEYENHYFYRVISVQSKNKGYVSNKNIFHVKGNKRSKWKRSIFYTSSRGFLSAKGSTNKELSQQQNSPITLGLAISWKQSNDKNINSSIYGSYYTPSTLDKSQNEQEIEIPLEVGFNIYQSYRLTSNFNGYYGYDFERIFTFNVDEVNEKLEEPKAKEQQLHYATLGTTFHTRVFDRPTLIKLSGSISFFNSGEVNKVNDKKLTATKGIFFIQHSIDKNFAVQTFYKKHRFSTASSVEITRYGAGISYNF